MAFYESIDQSNQDFIKDQKMFFVATTSKEGTINLSPKGEDSFKVISPTKAIWMNLTGSGNETAAHLMEDGRITIMFCAFEGAPKILRLYGKGTAIHPWDESWDAYSELFEVKLNSRQFIEIEIDRVQTSCGFSVPLYSYEGERDIMDKWTEKQGKDGIENYWKEKNTLSIDGKPTGIFPEEVPEK